LERTCNVYRILGSDKIPTRCGQTDSNGTFCRWGDKGKKYYYTPGDKASMARARAKAEKQGRAIHSTGWKEKSTDISKQSSKVQSLVFKKPKFNVSKAKSWAKSHGFKSNNVRETENTIRLQQFKPNLCTESGGMKELDIGVIAYICPILVSKSLQQNALSSINEIQCLINSIRNMSVDK